MNKIRILLADDHAVVRAGIRNALSELPDLEFVGEVGDGPSLEAALTQTAPDFLVIDVTMPNFDPLMTIRQIRARYPRMKILVVSAYDDDVYVQGLLGVGVDGYHLKDQSLSDLRLAVQRVLAGGKWVSSRLLDKLVGGTKPASPPPALTSRQRDILRLLQEGLDNQSIARRMDLRRQDHRKSPYPAVPAAQCTESLRSGQLCRAASGTPGDIKPDGNPTHTSS